MPIYKPSELRQFLTELGFNPKKVLSQNFLIDGNIIRKIVAASQVQANDVVLEIGPGPGSLTEALLEKDVTVVAVEKDKILAHALERLKKTSHRLNIFCEDIMKFPIVATMESLLLSGCKGKVIANLPYHLTTPILAQLIGMNTTLSTLTVMVQEEVARRFTALPGTKDYSSFTVFLNFFATAHYAFSVSRHCFYPEPNVDSAVVVLTLKAPPAVSNQEQFFNMTRAAFGQRRKMLRGSLRRLYSSESITTALEAAGLNPLIRPEELSLEDFLRLFESLQSSRIC